MVKFVGSPKDFWTGAICVVLGTAALYFGQSYKVGTAARMGPGYFPRALAALLITLGAIALIRSLVAKGEDVSRVAWKPMLLILSATALFALLLPGAGVIVALLALGLVSAAASKEFRFDWKAIAGLLGLVVLCVLVFVKGLGVPMPILGRWLQPFIAVPWLQ